MPTAPVSGWREVFADDFNGSSLNLDSWDTYDGQPGSDTGAWFASSHDSVSNSELVISAYRDPAYGNIWVTGGVDYRAHQTYGKYLVRMRRDTGAGISHALILWPANDTWPPEIDFSEDNASDPQTDYASLHYATAQGPRTIQRRIAVDLSQWHTWGVEWTPGKLVYTLDGSPWATVTSSVVPAAAMELCLQIQSWAAGVNSWEGPVGPTTPPVVNMDVDWVVVYAPA